MKIKVIVVFLLGDYTMGVVVQIQLRVHVNDVVVDRNKDVDEHLEVDIHTISLKKKKSISGKLARRDLRLRGSNDSYFLVDEIFEFYFDVNSIPLDKQKLLAQLE